MLLALFPLLTHQLLVLFNPVYDSSEQSPVTLLHTAGLDFVPSPFRSWVPTIGTAERYDFYSRSNYGHVTF